ncbi:putative metalloprotease CJM1_0395 family protein [Formivibrio citricus]|uniref:putative metalloprotease CJM1_0395 family protein n=1 Tax=Formivibrio citricus TaxID=83765 RepID=UPI001FDEC96A|nr:putative metalloprotease CJM1_0395 family protein [Formivibrio citricus]
MRTQKNAPDSETTASVEDTSSVAARKPNGEALNSEELAAIRELKNRDKTVRQHEAAHLAAAGGLAMSAASYSMQTGPDGKRYAIGGEVQIDITPGQTPEETVRKARIIQAAALAPAEPSAQDRSIAARAKAMEMQAEAEIAQRSMQEQRVASRYRVDSLPQKTLEIEA